jgi:uncharacterized protein (DUF1499 family)
MKTLAIIVALLIVAGVVGYMLLERRPGYGAYYGLAKLMGSRLDIGPVNWSTLTRHETPNDALVCPASHCPNAKPDAEPKIYSVAPAELLARLRRIALAEPDTSELSCGADCDHTARILQHTRLMRFPDTIDIAVIAVTDNQSTLAIYSRSLIGRSDFGVNRARIERWLAMLDASQR